MASQVVIRYMNKLHTDLESLHSVKLQVMSQWSRPEKRPMYHSNSLVSLAALGLMLTVS